MTTIKAIVAFFILFGAGCGGTNAAPEKELLRWKLVSGQKFHVRFVRYGNDLLKSDTKQQNETSESIIDSHMAVTSLGHRWFSLK